MKPVIPWSIKGIESETRVAAKAAAQRSGMTLGQWLNSKIKDEAALDEAAIEAPNQGTQEKSPSRTPSHTKKKTAKKAKVKKKKQAKKSGNIDSRLALLADQLTAISKDRQATAVNRFVGYDDEPAANKALEAMIKRIESGESQSRKSFEKVNTRLDVIDEKLTVSKGELEDESPQFQALESALRNIVDHIETSEKRNRDALGNMQDRMSDISKRAEQTPNTSVNQVGPELAALDARVTDLALQHEQATSSNQQENRSYLEERLATIGEQIDAVRHSTDAMTERAEISASDVAKKESREVEQRVAGMIGEARELMLKSAPSGEMLGSIRSEIESLNQRFDDIKSEAASDQDVQTLKLAIEKLTTSVTESPDAQPLVAMEQRLGELTQRLDEAPAADQISPQLSDLEKRIVSLDGQLAIAINQQGDAAAFSALESQISLVADRISATEEKLGALTTIEQSIAQLYTAIDDSKAEVQAVADGAAARMVDEIGLQGAPVDGQLGHSPELVALEQGLAAVKQSSHEAEQHNQETLEAVHETLEQIITKLADMEARDVANQSAVQTPHSAPEFENTSGNTDWQAAVQSHLQENLTHDPVDVSPAFDPARLGQAPDFMAQADAPNDLNLSDGLQDSLPRSPEEIAPLIAEATVSSEMSADNSPPLDYIAQARLASQSAAPQSKSSLAAGAGFFTNKIMPGRKADNEGGNEGEGEAIDQTAKKSKSLFSLPFLSKIKSAEAETPGENAHGEISNNNDPVANEIVAEENPGSRKRLILAGLVLLIAAGSFAYGKIGNKGGGNQQAKSVPTASAPAKTMQKNAAPTATAQPKKASQSIDQTSEIKNLVKQVSLSLPPKAPQLNRLPVAGQTGMPINQALEAGNTANDPVSSAPIDQVATASLPPAPSASHKIRSPLNIQTGTQTSLPQSEETTPETTEQYEANLPPEKTGTIALRRAAAKGDASAQFVIASRFVDGKRVGKDYSQAAKWYQKAASAGLPPAQYRLGTLFERGNGVPKDLNAARLWYERAAEKGNVKAMHNLAVIYAGTQNGQTDFLKAKKWFEQASNHGLKDSQYNLAVIHERGLVGGRSQKEALYWYSLAAVHGDRDAGVKAHSLKNYLTGPDIKAIEKRVSDWKPLKALKSGNFVAIKDPKWQVVSKTRSQPKLSAKPALAGKALVQSAQTMLSKLGFDVGGADGVMGSKTANAVRLFQLQNGLQVNGMVSNSLLQQLQARS